MKKISRHRQQRSFIFSLQYFIFPRIQRTPRPFKSYQLYLVIDSKERSNYQKKVDRVNNNVERTSNPRKISADYEAREAQVERRTRSPFGWKSRDVELSLLASAPQTRAPSVPGMLRHRGDWHRVHVEHRNSWN